VCTPTFCCPFDRRSTNFLFKINVMAWQNFQFRYILEFVELHGLSVAKIVASSQFIYRFSRFDVF
jgi:hypothetical protein